MNISRMTAYAAASRTRQWGLAGVACALALGAGCGDDGGRQENPPTGFPPPTATATATSPLTTAEGTGSASGPGGETGEDTSPLDEGGTGETGEPMPPPYGPTKPLAMGISVDSVWVNAGVPITVAAAGSPIDVPARTGRISAGRTTLVRATWTTDATFAPRQIEGLLTLTYPDFTQRHLTSVLMISGPPDPTMPGGTFSWEVPATDMLAGATYSVAFTETTGELGPDQPWMPSLLPQDEPGDLGVEDTNNRIRIHVLPYQHNSGGCSNVAPHDPAEIQLYQNAMMQRFPAASIEITVGAIVPWTGAMTDDNPLLDDVTARRAAEAPDDDVHYYGFLYPCDAGPASGGRAWLGFGPTDADAAMWRAGIGVYYPDTPDFSKETMVHEIGHTFGREHVTCSGEEGEPDPNYPHAGGVTNVRGWGVLDKQFREPTNADYMSYCETLWVSDYTWNATFTWLDAMTQFYGAEAPPPTPEGSTIVVTVDSDGTERVMVLPGGSPEQPRSSGHTLELRTADGAIQTFDARVRPIADGDGSYGLAAWVPTALLDDATEVTHVSASGRVSTSASAIRTVTRR